MRSYGCLRSSLTGSELRAEDVIGKIEVPKEYKIPGLRSIQDQGSKPICVSVSLTDMVLWNLNFYKVKSDISNDIFWRSDPNANEMGMSPMNAMEILVNGNLDSVIKHHFTTYALVTSSEVAKRCILQNGPVMVCMNVRSMSNDYWNGNQNYGGHATLLTGFDETGFTLRNSWGYEYGTNGYYTLPYNEFDNVFESWSLIK